MKASMRRVQFAVLALTLCLLPATCQAQSGASGVLPEWLGQAAGAAASNAGYSAFAGANPFKFISMLADMPLKEQRVILTVAGEGLQQQLGLGCNIFGGVRACQDLPQDSAVAKHCKGSHLKVDCAYAPGVDDDDLDWNPVVAFKDSLEPAQLRDIQDGCPRCFSNLQAMWCAQSAPKCGSFESVVEGAILPALTKATDAAEGGKGVQVALAAALPELLDAVGLSMPCREMCESVMATCACGDEPGHKFQTFGQLIEQVLASYETKGSALARIPRGFSETMFGRVWDRPLCSLFAWSNATDFAGTCEELPRTCLEKRWCKPGGGGPNAFEQHMALQLAKTVFGWVGSPDGPGLFETQKAIIDRADEPDVKQLSDKYLRHAGVPTAAAPRSKAQRATGYLLVLLAAALITTYAALGVLWWRRQQMQRADAAFRDERAEYADIPLADSSGHEERQGLL